LQKLGVPLFTFGETLHPALTEVARKEVRMVDEAQFLSSRLLCLSLHQGLTTADLARQCDIINEFLA